MTKQLTKKCLQDIKQCLIDNGWIKDEYGKEGYGYCLLGAYGAACLLIPDNLHEHESDLGSSWAEPLQNALGLEDVAQWNDDPDTNEELVFKVLDAAIKKAP